MYFGSVCQSRHVFVGLGLLRGDFGMCEKKGCMFWSGLGNVGVILGRCVKKKRLCVLVGFGLRRGDLGMGA